LIKVKRTAVSTKLLHHLFDFPVSQRRHLLPTSRALTIVNALCWRRFECKICTNVGSCAFAEGPKSLCCHLVTAQTCFLHKFMETVFCLLQV
jgi:hypothetical protein